MAKKIYSQSEYEIIEQQSLAAKEFLEDERFAFIREYIQNSLSSIEQSILNNTLMEERKTHVITDKLMQTFVKPKQVAVDELSGQYQWIKRFLDDLQYFATEKDEIDKEIENKRVIINDWWTASTIW